MQHITTYHIHQENKDKFDIQEEFYLSFYKKVITSKIIYKEDENCITDNGNLFPNFGLHLFVRIQFWYSKIIGTIFLCSSKRVISFIVVFDIISAQWRIPLVFVCQIHPGFHLSCKSLCLNLLMFYLLL